MARLEDTRVPVRLRLAGLWTSLMFCYVYGDYFGLYGKGKLQEMIDGSFGPLGPTTAGVLVGVSLMMAVPALMVFGSMALPAGLGKWMNIVLGVVYAAIMLLTMPGAPAFYLTLGVIEVLLSLATVVTAWRWPRLA
ncbi:hypothetical protein ABIE56_001604 [Luteibacter sp. 621]|jgi:hypothetical protein|uniref:DUF6326 family protein n=1 Tax=Luteibacter sp. 621 TaxID=3373916 RepID=UPI003D1DBCB1